MIISDELIRRQLQPYGFVPSSEQTERIRVYAQLLLKWNQKVSLTTIVDPVQVLRAHFGESIFARTAGLVTAGRLADAGSGAGFPGFPLAIVAPELEVTLIEPNLKKSVFLSEVKRELQMENVTIVRASMDNVDATDFDYVTARALGHFQELLRFAFLRTSRTGKVVLWLGEADAEKLRTSVGWRWRPALAIPLSERRCILLGEKDPSER